MRSAFLERLCDQLRREIRKQPKKAAGLGLLLLVGLSVWIPMLFSSASKPAPASTPRQPVPGAAIADAAPQARSTSNWSWERIEQLRAERAFQPRDAQLVTQLAKTGDRLFRFKTNSAAAIAAQPPEPMAAKTAAVEPKSAELRVTAIVTGPRFRYAKVNNKLASEGDHVSVGDDVIRVEEIRESSVLVSRAGRRWVVHVATTGKTARKGIEIKPFRQ